MATPVLPREFLQMLSDVQHRAYPLSFLSTEELDVAIDFFSGVDYVLGNEGLVPDLRAERVLRLPPAPRSF